MEMCEVRLASVYELYFLNEISDKKALTKAEKQIKTSIDEIRDASEGRCDIEEVAVTSREIIFNLDEWTEVSEIKKYICPVVENILKEVSKGNKDWEIQRVTYR